MIKEQHRTFGSELREPHKDEIHRIREKEVARTLQLANEDSIKLEKKGLSVGRTRNTIK